MRSILVLLLALVAGCGSGVVAERNSCGDDMSNVQALIAGYGNPLVICDSADFDGTNDYMTRGAVLAGVSDSKTGIFSAWVRIDGGDGASGRRIIMPALSVGGAGAARMRIWLNSSNRLIVQGNNSAGTEILSLQSSSTYAAGATWRHFLVSWDLAALAATIYVNDVDDTTVASLTDDTIDYTLADWGIGADPDGTEKFNGCIAELYFAPGQYLDFSSITNRRKFISASGKPVFLEGGGVGTGTPPAIFLHLDDGQAASVFATNRGTGGNFAITGTLDTGSTSPSD